MRFLFPATRAAAALALCLIAAAGCDSGPTEPDDGDDLVNGITKRDIRAGYIPTYPEIDAAFDVILTDDPTLPEDETRFARALFDEVNRAGDAKHAPAKAELPDLTTEEWIVVLNDPVLSAIAYPAADFADRTSQATFPCGAQSTEPFNRDKADALRHSYWSALTVAYLRRALVPENVAVSYALRLTTAHESESVGSEVNDRLREMDLSNNAAGIQVARDNGGASDGELLALLLALPLDFVEGPIPYDASRLVYFDGRDAYDVTLTGSFTNPDSNGGPWDATLTLSGCDQSLDGGLEITRSNGSRQRRRVGGNIVDGGVQLAFSLPFVFENPNALNACRDLQAELTGSPAALSGAWTSTNCSQGGQFSLTAAPSAP